MKSRYKILIFILLGLCLSSTLLFNTSALPLDSSEEEDLFLLLKESGHETEIQTRMIYDEYGNLHFFVKTVFDNDTFEIIHVVNDALTVIIREEYSHALFEAYQIEGGVSLFYSFHAFYGISYYHEYRWVASTGGEDTEIFNYNSGTNFPKEKIFRESNTSFNLILASIANYPPTGEDSQIRFRKYQYYLNGTMILGESYITEHEWEFLIDFHYVNETIYAGFRYMFAGFATHFYYTTRVDNATSEYDTHFWTATTGGFDPRWVMTDDGMFNFIMARNAEVYTLRYGVNDTVDLENATVTEIGIFNYNNFYIEKTDNGLEYIFDSVPYIDVEDFFSGKKLKTTISIIKNNFTHIVKEEFIVHNVPENVILHTFYTTKSPTEEREYVHSTHLSNKDLPDHRLSEEDMIGFYVSDNATLGIPLETVLLYVEVTGAGQIILFQVGIPIIVLVGVLVILLIVFRKKVKLFFANLKRFFKRPSGRVTNRLALFFVNFWHFLYNSFSSIYTLFKTNKKRHLMNLIGMTLLAVIFITTATVYVSKQEVLLDEYTSGIDIQNNGTPSLRLTLNYDTGTTGSSNPTIQNFEDVALGEIFTMYRTDYPYLASIISDYEYCSQFYVTLSNPNINTSTETTLTYLSLSGNYSDFVNEILVAGELPDEKGEIIISSDVLVFSDLNFTVGDNLTLYGSFINYYNSYIGDTNSTVKVVGIYDPPGDEQIARISSVYGLPEDAIPGLFNYFGSCIAFDEYAWQNFEGIFPYYMFITTYVQFTYDFSDFRPPMLTPLKLENDELIDSTDDDFSFSAMYFDSRWDFRGELEDIINILEPRVSSSMFLFFTLAVPILFLAMFVIFETNELYSQSLQQEIAIFQAKGVSSTRIATNYVSLKIVEAVLASFIGFGISLALSPALLKIDSFITFNAENQVLNLSGVLVSIIATIFIIVVISIPKIVSMSKSKSVMEKTPQRLVTLLKRIRFQWYALLAVGVAIAWGSLQLYSFLQNSLDASSGVVILMAFIYLAGFGVLIALFAGGMILKDVHSIIIIALSKISWNFRKTKSSFTLVEVRSDVKLFNNIFLAFLLIVGITLPSIIAPASIQFNYAKDVYMFNGADLYVNNWMDQNHSLLPVIENFTQVESTTFVRQIDDATIEFEPFDIYLIANTTEYLETSFKPPSRMFKDWEERILGLDENNTMMASYYFIEQRAEGEVEVTFSKIYPPIDEVFTITSEFEYVPIFYTVGPYKPSVSRRIAAVLMTEANYARIREIVNPSHVGENYNDRLLIKLSQDANHTMVKEMVTDLGLSVKCSSEEIEELRFTTFPFFNIVSAEFTLSILICIAAIVFISISNPIKILQQRTNKNDRLKKMGISTKRIIRMTMNEALFTGALPGLILGTAAGLGLISMFNTMIKRYFYGGIGYLTSYNLYALLISYVFVPLMFFSIFYFSMKRNYAKYMPRNLE